MFPNSLGTVGQYTVVFPKMERQSTDYRNLETVGYFTLLDYQKKGRHGVGNLGDSGVERFSLNPYIHLPFVLTTIFLVRNRPKLSKMFVLFIYLLSCFILPSFFGFTLSLRRYGSICGHSCTDTSVRTITVQWFLKI